MKNSLFKLLFVLCLLTGISCSQAGEETGTTEEVTSPETTGTEDTSAVSNEVPESLQQH